MNIVDTKVIDNLRDMLDDDDLLRADFLAFKEQLGVERLQLSEDLRDKNAERLSRLIRKIKLESSQFGATSLADKCRDLEASIDGKSDLTDGSLREAQDVLMMMESVEHFIDKRFALLVW